jgi:DNA-directed RNA polymerase specialized sigma24 family protein
MAQFNPDFWEVQVNSAALEQVPADKALWYETEVDRERRHAQREFFETVLPDVQQLMEARLTQRQREIVDLYFFRGLTQEEVAERLALTQSTVSRHLFGTTRNGRKVGGAIPKLRKAIDKAQPARIAAALDSLQQRFAEAV